MRIHNLSMHPTDSHLFFPFPFSTVFSASDERSIPTWNKLVKIVHELQPSSANRKIGSIVDYDPLNDNYGSIAASGYRAVQPANYTATSYYGSSVFSLFPDSFFLVQSFFRCLFLASSVP